jgi:hypothetical protein
LNDTDAKLLWLAAVVVVLAACGDVPFPTDVGLPDAPTDEACGLCGADLDRCSAPDADGWAYCDGIWSPCEGVVEAGRCVYQDERGQERSQHCGTPDSCADEYLVQVAEREF